VHPASVPHESRGGKLTQSSASIRQNSGSATSPKVDEAQRLSCARCASWSAVIKVDTDGWAEGL
jgi:hypothetical protein